MSEKLQKFYIFIKLLLLLHKRIHENAMHANVQVKCNLHLRRGTCDTKRNPIKKEQLRPLPFKFHLGLVRTSIQFFIFSDILQLQNLVQISVKSAVT